MTTLDYISVPPCATRLQDSSAQGPSDNELKRAPKIRTSLPHPPANELTAVTSPPSVSSPTRRSTLDLLPSLLLSSTLPSTAALNNNTNPRKRRSTDSLSLLSTRDPLSVQITTVNFKRFVERVGPVFWLQDRIEEIILWRRGWKLTTIWMAAYTFLCYFPRLMLLLPHFIVIGIILATYKYPAELPLSASTSQKSAPLSNAATGTVSEGSVDWQGNIQAIQNLMGLYADTYTMVNPYIPHITNKSPYTPHILTFLVLSLPLLITLLYLPGLPLRFVCLCIGILPLLLTNPYIRPSVIHVINYILPLVKQRLEPYIGYPHRAWRTTLERLIDDNNLKDECWVAPMREVELFENERLDPATNGWSKASLKPGERSAWTRGQDGWTGVGEEGSVSNLTFSLSPGWTFVDTEDWRADYTAVWADGAADSHGWVYTNDSWQDPRNTLGGSTVTRRRRWVRRIWCQSAQGGNS